MLVEQGPWRVPELADLACGDHSTAHVLEGGRAADAEDLSDVVGGEQIVTSEAELILHRALSAIRPPARPYGQHVDHLLAGMPVEDHAPLSDPQTPEAVRALETFDLPVREQADRRGDPLPILAAQPTKRLERARTDLDPPAAGISQRSAPPRPLTKRLPAPSETR